MQTVGVISAREDWFRDWTREIANTGGAKFVRIGRREDVRGYRFDLVIVIGDSGIRCSDGSDVYELFGLAQQRRNRTSA